MAQSDAPVARNDERQSLMKRKYVVIAIGRRDEVFDDREDAEGYAWYLTTYHGVIADVFPM